MKNSFKAHLCFFLLTAIVAAICTLSCNSCSRSTPDSTGVVSAATPEAAEAGAEILKADGNAIDAAVAISFALTVSEPALSGLGGQTQILLYAPGKEPVVINGTSFSPKDTPDNVSRSDLSGHRATTIPATVRTLEYAWKKYGSGNISWPELLAPAIRYAEEGFVIGPFRHQVLSYQAEELRKNPVTQNLFLNRDGTIPPEGSVRKQPVLAKTLRRLAEYGADDFYSGSIAREIASDMKANGGWITLTDLQNVTRPVELKPLRGTYRGWDVFTLPPPGGGWVVLQVLNLLEQFPPGELTRESPDRLFHLAEALQIGHQNRRDFPVGDLVEYKDEVAEKISKETAEKLLKPRERSGSGETTHFSVADADGMVVSVSASINNYFGAEAAHPTLGFLYNDYMHEFEIGNPGHPYAMHPGAMPYSSMSPTILAKKGQPLMGLGSPGSARIISAIVQVVHLWVDAGFDIEEAVAAGRIHVIPDKKLYFESNQISDSVYTAFKQRGYTIKKARSTVSVNHLNPYFGGVHAVARENGRWRGAADPRRDGAVTFAK
jgi:gamma-glutamyltranspeptidase/glutathione hydrolase